MSLFKVGRLTGCALVLLGLGLGRSASAPAAALGILEAGARAGPGLDNVHRTVEAFQLPNGLRVVLQPDPQAHSTAVQVWYRVGSDDDPAGAAGMAHLFEHLFFGRTSRSTARELIDVVESNGGSATALTMRDATAFYSTFDSKVLARVLEIESLRMSSLALIDGDIERERLVVGEEIKSSQSSSQNGLTITTADGRSLDIAGSGLGSVQSLSAISYGSIRRFYRQWYKPSNAVLSISGNFDPRIARAQIQKYFAARGDAHALRWVPKAVLPSGLVKLESAGTSELAGIAEGPSLSDRDLPAFLVADAVIRARSGSLAKATLAGQLRSRPFAPLSKRTPYIFPLGLFAKGEVLTWREVREAAESVFVEREALNEQSLGRSGSAAQSMLFTGLPLSSTRVSRLALRATPKEVLAALRSIVGGACQKSVDACVLPSIDRSTTPSSATNDLAVAEDQIDNSSSSLQVVNDDRKDLISIAAQLQPQGQAIPADRIKAFSIWLQGNFQRATRAGRPSRYVRLAFSSSAGSLLIGVRATPGHVNAAMLQLEFARTIIPTLARQFASAPAVGLASSADPLSFGEARIGRLLSDGPSRFCDAAAFEQPVLWADDMPPGLVGLAAVGPVDDRALAQLRSFARAARPHSREGLSTRGAATVPGGTFIYELGGARSAAALQILPLLVDTPDEEAFEIAAKIVSKRVVEIVRNRLSLSYIISTRAIRENGLHYIVIEATLDPDKIPALLSAFQDVRHELRQVPISSDELVAARAQAVDRRSANLDDGLRRGYALLEPRPSAPVIGGAEQFDNVERYLRSIANADPLSIIVGPSGTGQRFGESILLGAGTIKPLAICAVQAPPQGAIP